MLTARQRPHVKRVKVAPPASTTRVEPKREMVRLNVSSALVRWSFDEPLDGEIPSQRKPGVPNRCRTQATCTAQRS